MVGIRYLLFDIITDMQCYHFFLTFHFAQISIISTNYRNFSEFLKLINQSEKERKNRNHDEQSNILVTNHE